MTSATSITRVPTGALRLLAASRAPMATVGPEGDVRWSNPAWDEAFPDPEAIAERLPAVGPGEHVDAEVACGGRWFALAVTGDADRPERHVVAHDVTAGRSDAFDDAPVGMALIALDGRYLRVNRAFAELTGRGEHELLEGRWTDIVHGEDVPAGCAAIASMVEGLHATWTTEQRYLHPLGQVVYARVHMTLVRDEDGRPAHCAAQIEDITQSRRLLEALSLSVARYRTLVRNLPDTVITLFDHDLRYHLAEGAGMSRLGKTEDDYVARTPVGVHGREHGGALETAFRAALDGEPQLIEWATPDGVAYAHHVVPLLDAAGAVIGGMGVTRDVTELRTADAQREAHTAELERSNAELEQFAYVASHDLSEPLRMVTSYLQLVQRRYAGQIDADADEFITFAVNGAARMRSLIDDLLAYSRVGRKERPFEAIDMLELVEQVTGTLPLGDHEEDDVIVEIGDLPAVLGDPSQLGQLFQNLIGNAIKFVPAERTAHVRVLAAPEARGAHWRFTVADNGIGIDPKHADRVFRMFQRLHTREEYEGTGIGLAIAKKVVERHGGRIWLDPDPPGGGACFHFTLPVDPGQAAV